MLNLLAVNNGFNFIPDMRTQLIPVGLRALTSFNKRGTGELLLLAIVCQSKHKSESFFGEGGRCLFRMYRCDLDVNKILALKCLSVNWHGLELWADLNWAVFVFGYY